MAWYGMKKTISVKAAKITLIPFSISESNTTLRKSTFATCLDIRKAFDRVYSRLLWSKLSDIDLRGKMASALQKLHDNINLCAKITFAQTSLMSIPV